MVNKEEIIRALTLWFQPGDVFEIRVLDAVTSDYRREHVESGYFDYDHIEAVPEALKRLMSYRGVYVTVNPVKPDLLARAVNRIRSAGKNPTTADADIVSRRWLLIDCDAVRPSGVSSSDAEHNAALAKAQEIGNGLSSLGWTEPIMTDSGNGAQLMYRIDLPTDDGGLVQKAVAEIAKASSEQVAIDLTVHNPARIWRLPGTMNCKGDSIPARPHRTAKIISKPQDIRTVSAEQILDIVGGDTVKTVSHSIPGNTQSAFDIDTWIAKYCPELGASQPWKGGRRWIFPVCPFNEAHTNRSAVLIEQDSGAIAFRCHHNGCAGNDWQKLRELREPGCYEKKPERLADVNISGILNQKPKDGAAYSQTDKQADVVIDLVPLPESLYHVPGFIHDVMKFCLDTAPSPQPELALACAIALQGHLAGRKVECLGGIRTNTYIIMLAPSGSGKNHPRRVVRRILAKVGLNNEIFEDTSSGQGIEDLLVATPKVLWLSDEIYEMLQSIISDKTGTKEKVMKILLTLHTSAGDDYTTRVKAGTKGTTVNCPHLTMLGACTTEGFFKSINEPFIGHGMFARMELFPSETQPEPKIPGNLNNIPVNIEHHALQWKNFNPIGSGNIDIVVKEVVGDKSVMSLLREYQLEAFREKKKLQDNGEPDWKLSLWSRAFESIVRFALIYACSEAKVPDATTLSVSGLRWAHELVHWDIKNKLAMVQKFYYKTDFERISEQIVSLLYRWHKRRGKHTPMPGWDFNRKTKELSPKVKEAAIQSLQAQERIEVNSVQTAGRPLKTYSLCF